METIKGVSVGRANILSTNKKILHYDTLHELVNKLLTSNIDAKSINKGSFGKRCIFNDRTFELIGLIDGKIDYSGIKDIGIRQVSYYGKVETNTFIISGNMESFLKVEFKTTQI